MTDHRDISLEQHDGHPAGCDPRALSADELLALGHQRMSPIKALRARCVDCCGGSPREVRLCPAVGCPAWPFRMGKSPWRPAPSEARLEHLRTLAVNRANTAKIQHPDVANSDETEVPATTLPGAPNDRRIVKCMGGNR